MSIRSFDNWNRYLDNQNHPLHGCIQFNVKDGNTIAPIYDSDGTPLNNPIITDEYGRTQHQVFIEEDVVAYYYKYIGNGIWNTQLDIDTSDTTKWSLQYTSENQYSIDGNITTDSPYSVNTIQDLRTIDPSTVPNINGVKYITLLGYNEAGDKEPINYIWDSNSTLPDDGGAVISTNELTGRWIMITPTEHLDVRHYGVFPSNSQNMLDQTEQIQRAMTYANSKGLRLFFDTYSDTQTYRYYKLSNITLTPIQIIDVSKGVQFIDTNVTIRSTSKEAFNNDPYFVNGDTNLYSNFAKSSWNIKTLNKSQSNVEATYIIDDSTKSTNITTLQGWNVVVNANITGYTFHLCNISGVGLIDTTSFTSCNLDVIGTLGDYNSYINCHLTEFMFNGSPTPGTVTNCTIDIDDFTHKVNLWNSLNFKMGTYKDIDFKNVTIPTDFFIYNQELGDRTYSNFIGTGASHTFGESSIQHVYRFNNVQGNIIIPGNANNTYVFDNCSVNLTWTITTPACTIIIRDSEVILNSNLPNATVIIYSSTATLNSTYANVSVKDSTITGIYSSTRLNTPNFSAFTSILNQEVASYNIVIKDSQINKEITSKANEDNELVFFFDNNIFNAQHILDSTNTNQYYVTSGVWTNNIGNVVNPINIGTGIVDNDSSHAYVYEGNSGTFRKRSYIKSKQLTVDTNLAAPVSLTPADKVYLINPSLVTGAAGFAWFAGIMFSIISDTMEQPFTLGRAIIKMNAEIKITGQVGLWYTSNTYTGQTIRNASTSYMMSNMNSVPNMNVFDGMFISEVMLRNEDSVYDNATLTVTASV